MARQSKVGISKSRKSQATRAPKIPKVREVDISAQKFVADQKWIVRPSFGDYVTQNRQFLEYLSDVSKSIETYISRERTKRPLNILLSAPPGAGKSFLIKQIVNSLSEYRVKTSYEEVYVASFDSIDET